MLWVLLAMIVQDFQGRYQKPDFRTLNERSKT